MNLKELRKKNNLSQQEISNILNIAQRTYSGYELETSEPNIDTLCKLADYYEVSLDYLIGRERKNDIGFLNPEQIEAVKLLQSLNQINLRHTVSFMQGLYVNQ